MGERDIGETGKGVAVTKTSFVGMKLLTLREVFILNLL